MSKENIEKIKLRRATVEDIDDILQIEGKFKDLKVYSAWVTPSDVTEQIQKHFVYLIEKDGKIVGDISYEIKSDDHAYISGIAVDPEFQGQGIARQATKVILEELKNAKLIDLITHPDNEKAISLYRSLGFKETDKRYENYFGDGEPRIKMVLEK